MSNLVTGDDGFRAEGEVGEWVEEKHRLLAEYLKLHSAARKGYSSRRNAYIDLFCGPGRLKVRGTGHFVAGSPIVAWTNSVKCGAPFSEVYVADTDEVRRELCVERLRRLGAPVIEIRGSALEAATSIVPHLDPQGLHFAFVDPYNLAELRRELLSTLAAAKRMDIMVHLSAMDLFRNFEKNVTGEQQELDAFAPGWRSKLRPNMTREAQRIAAVEHWKALIDQMGMKASPEMRQIRNTVNRDLYWLLLIARHDLAQKFFKIALKSSNPQQGFDGF